jgi:predicted nucleotidyltransferase
MPQIDQNSRQAILSFSKKVHQAFQIDQIIMFGSRARGDHHPESDLDLAIIMSTPNGDFFQSKFAMDDIAYDILLETGIRIQPLPIWKDEWNNPETYSNPYLLSNIQQYGIHL